MSTSYRITKLDYPEYFDLGKGTSELFEYYEPFLIRQFYRIPQEFVEKFEELMESKKWDISERFLYASRVANRLFEWAKFDRLIVCTDTSFESINYYLEKYNSPMLYKVCQPWNIRDISHVYKEIGSRYE